MGGTEPRTDPRVGDRRAHELQGQEGGGSTGRSVGPALDPTSHHTPALQVRQVRGAHRNSGVRFQTERGQYFLTSPPSSQRDTKPLTAREKRVHLRALKRLFVGWSLRGGKEGAGGHRAVGSPSLSRPGSSKTASRGWPGREPALGFLHHGEWVQGLGPCPAGAGHLHPPPPAAAALDERGRVQGTPAPGT